MDKEVLGKKLRLKKMFRKVPMKAVHSTANLPSIIIKAMTTVLPTVLVVMIMLM